MSEAQQYVRICPVCGSEHPPEVAYCQCGVLLSGVDLSLKADLPPPPEPTTASPALALPDIPPAEAAQAAPATPATQRCPHADCGMDNPPKIDDCLYCGRPLAAMPATKLTPQAHLYNLPAALREKFRIERVLPAGGAEAEIMIVAGLETGARAVVKLYRPGIQPKSGVLERVGKVAFAHVVRLIAHGVSEGVAWELMEYCQGGSLRNLMQPGPMDEALARQVLKELAGALQALHAQQVIHRDLKPENVLIRRREPLDLVLTDFGIASLREQTQVFTSVARSTLYAAPEALSGVLEPATDYWSLGMILLEALTGRHPYAGLSEPVIAHRLTTSAVPVELTLPAWRKLLRGLLQRDPQRRWGAAELARWLAEDASLPEPLAEGARASRAYRIGEDEATSAAELAVLLARHWREARKDVARGHVTRWIDEQLGEQNLTRTVHDLMDERGLSDDLRLFRLLRLLAPDIPPIWQDAGLSRKNLLARAQAASQNDLTAGRWLASLYDEKVLRQLPDLADLQDSWQQALADFDTLWQRALSLRDAWCSQRRAQGGGLVDFDALVFGHVRGMEKPARERLLAILLLAVALPESRSTLIGQAQTQLAALLDEQPWLEKLFAEAEKAPQAVLVVAEAAAQALAQEKQHAVKVDPVAPPPADQQLAVRAAEVLARLHFAVEANLFGFPDAQSMRAAIADFQQISIEARQQDFAAQDGETHGGAWRNIARAEPIVWRLQEKLSQWESIQRLNMVATNRHVLNTIVTIAFIALIFAPPFLPWLLAGMMGVGLWRFWLMRSLHHELRKLVDGLPVRSGTMIGGR